MTAAEQLVWATGVQVTHVPADPDCQDITHLDVTTPEGEQQ